MRISNAIGRRAMALGGLAWMILAAPAVAMQADCLWTHLSQARRDAVMADYAASGPEALDRLRLPDHEMAPAYRACGVRPAETPRAGHLLGAQVALLGSEAFFEHNEGLAADRLAAAWANMPTSDRQRVRRFAVAATLKKPTDRDDIMPVMGLAIDLGVDVGSGRPLEELLSFATGRALLDSWDGQD